MIGYVPDWDFLMQNTRDDVMIRKDTCTACECWNSERCVKWELVRGRTDPWTGIFGVCPLQRWAIGRKKGSGSGRITEHEE